MRIACLQFAPQVGDVDNNLNRADAVLSKANPRDLDLLVLPELAFSGYNFQSLQHITPFLEPTGSGITSLWARTTALKYNCVVTAGYPEKVEYSTKEGRAECYNSAITVSADGETLANYRKSFLYYTDETWALEGRGFYSGEIEGLGSVAMGICMDLNPYKFEAPWVAWEFAHHILHVQANLVILSMAWLTREDISSFSRTPRKPDMETLAYWLSRLEPVIRLEAEGEIIVVFANRCGTEDDVIYAGTSAVLGISAGEVKVYGILGRGEKELLLVDTDRRPEAKLVSLPSSAVSTHEEAQNDSDDIVEEPESTATDRGNETRHLPVAHVRNKLDSTSEHADEAPGYPDEDVKPLDTGYIDRELGNLENAAVNCKSTSGPKSEDSYEADGEHGYLSPMPPSHSRHSQAYVRGETLDPPDTSQSSSDTPPPEPSPEPFSFRQAAWPIIRNASRDGPYGEDEPAIEDFYRNHAEDPDPSLTGGTLHPAAMNAEMDKTYHMHEQGFKELQSARDVLPYAAKVPAGFECSFTRNPLGPRSRHISPRPSSTLW